MAIKIKAALLDIITGSIASIIIDSFSKFVYFDYITCAIITALIYLFVGIIRGGIRIIPLSLKVLFINTFSIISILFIPLPVALFLPIVFVAVIFTYLGLNVRIKWRSELKIKYVVLALFSLIFIITLSFLLYPRFISKVYTEQLHRPAVEFKFVSFKGDTIKSMDIKGNVIVLEFWDSGCKPCIASMPDLERLYQTYKDHPNVKIFCVNVAWKPLEKEKSFVLNKGYNLPFVYDEGKTNEQLLGFNGSGYLIIIDKKYNIRIIHSGYNHAEDFIGSLARHIEHFISES
jgi:thiol-disulfide isomerase/thioredoxin